MNNIFNRKEYLQHISESKDIIIKNNDEDYDRYIDGDRIFNSDESTQIYFDRISKNLRKIKNTEISRISGDYEDIEDEIVDDYNIVRDDESLYAYIKDVKTSTYIDLSNIINEDYIKWFNKVLTRSKVGKGEFLLPILFYDVCKSTSDLKYDNFMIHNDEVYPIEIKASVQGSWDHCVPKNEPTDKYNHKTENEYKTFIAETIYNYCKGRRLNNMYLIFFDINLNGILVINTDNSKEELIQIIYDRISILDNVISRDNNFNSFCSDEKIKCALPKRNIDINDDTISVTTHINHIENKKPSISKKVLGDKKEKSIKSHTHILSKVIHQHYIPKSSNQKLSDIQDKLIKIKNFEHLSREEQVAYIYFEKQFIQNCGDIAEILYGDRSRMTSVTKYLSNIKKAGGYSEWLKKRASRDYKDIID